MKVEVIDQKSHPSLKVGQVLTVVRQTRTYLWVKLGRREYQINKESRLVVGTKYGYVKPEHQALVDF